MSVAGEVQSGDALSLRLIGIDYAGEQTGLFRFARPDGLELPQAMPGMHITLCLPGGLERQYSLIETGVALRSYSVGIKREATGRGGSAYVHDQLRVGHILPVLPPRNNFPLVEEASHSVLIGGGIGVTPLIAMAGRLGELGRDYVFHAAFRSAGDVIMHTHLARLGERVRFHLDQESGGVLDITAVLAQAPRDAHLYCCGPVPMIEAFLQAASRDGRPDDHVHVEFFSATQGAASEGNFTLELARSGLVLEVPPGRSILDMVREAGISALASCEQGVCGACEVAVLDGVPDHRDAVLSVAERKAGKSMMICCSGSLSNRLVIDL